MLGIDVGFSPTRRSSAVCRLDWDAAGIGWSIARFRAGSEERASVIGEVAGAAPLLAAAFDGPLRGDLAVIDAYRTAERMLTRRLGARIGKPGPSHVPVGRALNAAANACARTVLDLGSLAVAGHPERIHARALVEAFPSGFLGAMLDDPRAVATRRGDRSDRYFLLLAADGTLARLLAALLPSRTLRAPLEGVRDHDERAALVCAITALCVARGDYTAVGDADGWIVLPPRGFVQDAAWADLEANAAAEAPGCLIARGGIGRGCV